MIHGYEIVTKPFDCSIRCLCNLRLSLYVSNAIIRNLRRPVYAAIYRAMYYIVSNIICQNLHALRVMILNGFMWNGVRKLNDQFPFQYDANKQSYQVKQNLKIMGSDN